MNVSIYALFNSFYHKKEYGLTDITSIGFFYMLLLYNDTFIIEVEMYLKNLKPASMILSKSLQNSDLTVTGLIPTSLCGL